MNRNLKPLIFVLALCLVLSINQFAAITVTSPSSATKVRAAEDFATAAFQDPWDMNQQTDLGWFIFDVVSGSKSNLTDISFSNGIFSASATTNDPNISVLETGVIGTCFLGKIGTNYKINADKYYMLAYRMKLNTSHNSLLFWSRNTIYNGTSRSGEFGVSSGWGIYIINIPSKGAYAIPGQGPVITWSGYIDSLRYDPVPVKANIDIDWIRLVERNITLYRTIQWTGNTGNVDIYLDNDKNEGNGTLGKVAANVSGTSYSLYAGALSPGFNYYIGIKPSSGGAMKYSAGYYWVNDIPTMVFTSPSPEGGDDFATVELGNAWDMNSTSDLDGYANLSGAPTATTINAVDRAGSNLNNLTVLKGTNKSGSYDPILFLLWFDGGRGASTKIDSSKYRILVLKMGLPGNWDLVGGSVARVYWHVQGEFNGNVEKMNQSADVIIRHKSGSKVTMDTIIADMKDLTLEQSQSTTGWNGMIDGFRIDPHEFTPSKTFYIDEVKLAAFERADKSYTIKWQYTNTHSTSAANFSLYYDTNDKGYNGTRIKSGINPASGQYTWDTSNMGEGTYYIYAVYTDGTNSNRTYARWPIVIDHTPTPPPTAPAIKLNKSSLTFSASGGNSQSFTVSNSGGGTLNWSVSDNRAWMSVSPTSGQNSGTVTVTVNRSGLSGGTYKGTVTVTDSNAGNSPQTVSVTLYVSGGGSGGTPTIGINRSKLNFGAAGSKITSPQVLLINNNGTGTLNWSISENRTWLKVSPSSGTNSGVVTVTADKSGLAAGTYYGAITISDPNASISTRNLPVYLRVHKSGSTGNPFGDFATPIHGSTVRSSIPVTGWVLDDIEVKNVKIYNGSNYVGDAVFVDGARPDVEAAYPDYPRNYQAGWGYMMLTNFLPGGGNGKYTIRAKATDAEGHTVTLGSKTIIVDNANAVKPFGAIDTPTQGGTASGANFINWGWALTPLPNKIPTNGSTIDVAVNGVKIGRPTYNNYRSDIAGLFPSYHNSNGAVGYFYLDTTAYKNGVHTIQWIARDNAGNNDGIGSRFFTIQNTGGNRAFPAEHKTERAVPGAARAVFNVDDPQSYSVLSRFPVDNRHPIRVKRGFEDNKKPQIFKPDENGNIMVEIKELERIEIHLTPGTRHVTPEAAPVGRYSGFLSSAESLKPLPVGSTLDAAGGVFYWSPGPGFVGDYELVFIDALRNRLKRVNIRILPKYSLD